MTGLTDLMATLRDWADRQDLTDGQVWTLIRDAEDRFNYELRVKEMMNVDQAFITNNAADLPLDFIEMDYLRLLPNPTATTPTPSLTSTSPNALIAQGTPLHYVSRDEFYTITGNPYHPKYNQPFFAVIGQSLLINPQLVITDQTQAEIGYYARLGSLVDIGDNPVYSAHPRIYRFAALGASAAFLGEDDRVPIWEANATNLIRLANESWVRAKSSGGPLNMRFRTFG